MTSQKVQVPKIFSFPSSFITLTARQGFDVHAHGVMDLVRGGSHRRDAGDPRIDGLEPSGGYNARSPAHGVAT